MKSRLNLSIEEDLLKKINIYAQKRDISLSELVEDHFKELLRKDNHKNVIELIESLDKPEIGEDIDLKKEFFRKRGF